MVVTKEEFGKKIKNIRTEKRFSVRQAALQSGISNSFLSQVENGKRNIPKPETLKKIAKGLRISEDEIMYIAGYAAKPTNIQVTASPDGALVSADSEYRLDNSDVAPISVPDLSESVEVFGEIHAGPAMYAEENVIGSVNISSNLLKRYGADQLFGLIVKGDSMNNVVLPGYTAVFVKDVEPENGDIVAVLLDGDTASIKRYRETSKAFIFEPDSSNPLNQPIIVPKTNEDRNCKILGKFIFATSQPI